MRDKWAIREDVWTALETARVVRGRSVHDKIPHFLGCEDAAALVSELPEWQTEPLAPSRATRTKRSGPCVNWRWNKESCCTWRCRASRMSEYL